MVPVALYPKMFTWLDSPRGRAAALLPLTPFSVQPFLRLPGPPNFGMSRQFAQAPQSAWIAGAEVARGAGSELADGCGADGMRRSHRFFIWFRPPNLGLSKHAVQSPQSSSCATSTLRLDGGALAARREARGGRSAPCAGMTRGTRR